MTDDDPEVRADLELRAQTIRERGHSPMRFATWSKPEIAARWPCRACREYVEVTGDAVERVLAFNRELLRRQEAPLAVERIVFCDKCRDEGRRIAPELRRKQVEKLRDLIQQLKRSKVPERERELILQLEKLDHPDVNGLVAAIRARIESKGRRDGGGL